MKTESDYVFYTETWKNSRDFSVLTGQTIESVTVYSDEQIVFETQDGYKYEMFHEQDCCESVVIESIVGDLKDLIGQKIELAEERNNLDLPAMNEWDDSFTWTFYTLRTVKSSVDIRWHGSSNGFYSESVDFKRIA